MIVVDAMGRVRERGHSILARLRDPAGATSVPVWKQAALQVALGVNVREMG